jgi:hypothetical protein
MEKPNMPDPEKPAICYLCSETLAEPVSNDHVPMQQLFARELRKKHKPSNLLTIPVHDRCNKSYQGDEDYFVHSLRRSLLAHIPATRSTKRRSGTIETARTPGSSVKYWASSNHDWCFLEIKG